MIRLNRMWRNVLCFGIGALLLLGMSGYGYVRSLELDKLPVADRAATAADLPFLAQRPAASRGRILAVVSSTAMFPDGEKKAGYELTELSRAYWVFVANGYQVDIASPAGGEPPMRLDQDDVTDADFAFLNDAEAMQKLTHSLPLAKVDPAQYRAVYFVGGKGTMFDFPGNPDIARIVHAIDRSGGVLGAVCHGPVAFIGLRGTDGTPWLQGRHVTGFSNAEELFLMQDARERFAYLLQDELQRQGGVFTSAPKYLDHTVVDGRLVTGQNPWSTWHVAEQMIRQLGHVPVPRATTGEEASVRVLLAYHRDGVDAARAQLEAGPAADRRLLLMHAIIAAMQWKPGEAWLLQSLARAVALPAAVN